MPLLTVFHSVLPHCLKKYMIACAALSIKKKAINYTVDSKQSLLM